MRSGWAKSIPSITSSTKLSGLLMSFFTGSRTFLVKLFAAGHNKRDLASGTPSENGGASPFRHLGS